MNIVKIILLCAVLVFAEQSLRGFAYNPYGTLGAAPTIADILQKPSDVYWHKFVYVSPESGSGYSAFDLAGGSALLGFDQSLMLGYAKSFYGLSLSIFPHKLCNRVSDDKYECSSNQNIGMNFSVPLGSSILYAYTGKITTSGYDGDDDDILKQESFVKKAYIGITGGDRLVWDLKFSYDLYKTSSYRYMYNDKFLGIANDTSDTTDMKFLLNLGYKILQSDKLKFIVGLNNEFSYSDFDNYYLQAIISPNFLGEMALTKHLLTFVGASYSISSYVRGATVEGDTNIDVFYLYKYEPGAYAGLRYEYENLAVETRLQSDTFEELLSGNNPFIALGVFFFFR